jgi:hypothetical protein
MVTEAKNLLVFVDFSAFFLDSRISRTVKEMVCSESKLQGLAGIFLSSVSFLVHCHAPFLILSAESLEYDFPQTQSG